MSRSTAKNGYSVWGIGLPIAVTTTSCAMLREGHPGTQELKDVEFSKTKQKVLQRPRSLSLSLLLLLGLNLSTLEDRKQRPNETITARFVFAPPLEGGQIRFSTWRRDLGFVRLFSHVVAAWPVWPNSGQVFSEVLRRDGGGGDRVAGCLRLWSVLLG